MNQTEVINGFTSWQQLPNGARLRRCIETEIRDSLEESTGERLLAVGPLAHELDMSAFKGGQRIRLDAKEGDFVDLVSEAENLPIESNSIDILILPLVLEYSQNPHQILREAQRVVVEGGSLYIIGFNPFSAWGLRSWWGNLRRQDHWNGQLLAGYRIQDWLQLLQFQVFCKKGVGPVLPFEISNKELSNWLYSSMYKQSSNRLGGLQMILATKTVPAMTPIRLKWKKFAVKSSAEVNARQGAANRTK